MHSFFHKIARYPLTMHHMCWIYHWQKFVTTFRSVQKHLFCCFQNDLAGLDSTSTTFEIGPVHSTCMFLFGSILSHNEKSYLDAPAMMFPWTILNMISLSIASLICSTCNMMCQNYWFPFFLNFLFLFALYFFCFIQINHPGMYCPVLPHIEFWPFLGPSLLQNVRVLPHPKFWPFLGRPLKNVLDFFPNLWAGFVATHNVHCLLCLPLCLPLVSCFGLGCVLSQDAARCARFGMAASTNGHSILWDCRAINTEVKKIKKTKHRRKPRWTKTNNTWKQCSPCFSVQTSPGRPATFAPKNTAYARSGVLVKVFGCLGLDENGLEIKHQRKTLADKQHSPCFLVKTSAGGRRRFHKNTAYARLGV